MSSQKNTINPFIKGKVLRCRALYPDHLNRWLKGEVGELALSSDLKYDYFVVFEPMKAEVTCNFFEKGQMIARAYFFMKDEIEVITK